MNTKFTLLNSISSFKVKKSQPLLPPTSISDLKTIVFSKNTRKGLFINEGLFLVITDCEVPSQELIELCEEIQRELCGNKCLTVVFTLNNYITYRKRMQIIAKLFQTISRSDFLNIFYSKLISLINEVPEDKREVYVSLLKSMKDELEQVFPSVKKIVLSKDQEAIFL